MSNPFYDQYGHQQPQDYGLLGKFYEFSKNFQGDPKQKVQELLNSGQMTQDQFNMLSQMAKNFQNRK